MRAIDADKLCEDLLKRWDTADKNKEKLIAALMAEIVTPIVVSQPTIGERKKGEWVDFSMSIKGVPTEACGECGEWSYGMGKNYCPNCGADMRGEQP